MKNKKQKRGKFKIFSLDNRIIMILNRVRKIEAETRRKEEENKRGVKLFLKEIIILRSEY